MIDRDLLSSQEAQNLQVELILFLALKKYLCTLDNLQMTEQNIKL